MPLEKPSQKDFLIPMVFLIFLVIICQKTNIDHTLANFFFTPPNIWPYRNNFFLEKILHKGGVIFIISLFTILLSCLYYLTARKKSEVLKKYIFFTITSSLLTILIVYGLKFFSLSPCPWHSIGFSPDARVAPGLLHLFSFHHQLSGCFPAGHSSGGFGFLSLYFAHLIIKKKRNLLYLLPGLIIGVLFGIAQEMRGAHFISHDFATIFISIFSSWITAWFFFIWQKI